MKRGFSPQTVGVGKGVERSRFGRHFAGGDRRCGVITLCTHVSYTSIKKEMTWWYVCWGRGQRYHGAMTWVHLSFFKTQSGEVCKWHLEMCLWGWQNMDMRGSRVASWHCGALGSGVLSALVTDEGVAELLLLPDASVVGQGFIFLFLILDHDFAFYFEP